MFQLLILEVFSTITVFLQWHDILVDRIIPLSLRGSLTGYLGLVTGCPVSGRLGGTEVNGPSSDTDWHILTGTMGSTERPHCEETDIQLQ